MIARGLLLALVLLSSACAASLQKAQVYSEQGRPDKVIAVCRKLVRKAPRNQEAWALLGTAYADVNDYRASLVALDQALLLDPNDANSHGARGYVLVQTGDPAAAVQSLSTGLNLNPRSVESYYFLGVAYWDLGAGTQASQAFETYLSRSTRAADDPMVRDVQNRLRVLQAALAAPSESTFQDSSSDRYTTPAPQPEPASPWSAPEPTRPADPPLAPPPPVAAPPPSEGGGCRAVATVALDQAGEMGRGWAFKQIAKELSDNELAQAAIAGGLELFWQVFGKELMQQQGPALAENLCTEGSRLLQILLSLDTRHHSNVYPLG